MSSAVPPSELVSPRSRLDPRSPRPLNCTTRRNCADYLRAISSKCSSTEIEMLMSYRPLEFVSSIAWKRVDPNCVPLSTDDEELEIMPHSYRHDTILFESTYLFRKWENWIPYVTKNLWSVNVLTIWNWNKFCILKIKKKISLFFLSC